MPFRNDELEPGLRVRTDRHHRHVARLDAELDRDAVPALAVIEPQAADDRAAVGDAQVVRPVMPDSPDVMLEVDPVLGE